MIPYNPSSFDRNKTILEQILELKNWLKAHPSYEIFYSSENGQSVADTGYLLSAIADPTNLAVGDVVIFSNAMVGAVLSVDADNGTYGCDACVSFKGPQGVQGPAGADGQNGTDGTCIRYCNYNKNLNPNTTYAITDITFSTGLQVNDCILFKNNLIGFVDNISGGTFRVTGNIRIDGKDGAYISNAQIDSNGDLIITIYDPETMISSSDNVGHVVGPAGQGMQVINTTTSTGTLSASDLAKANGTDDCILIFTDNGADLTMQRILKDSSSVYFYAHFVDTGKASFLLCEVNAVTGAYTISGGDLPIKASNIDSDTATNGQVLQADGNGGASWQNASGSFTHYVIISSDTSGTISLSDIPKLQYNDSVLIYQSGTNTTFYNKDYETSSNIYFTQITSSAGVKEIKVVKSTGAYEKTSSVKGFRSSAIDSQTATNGQVLTANGSGGASWQTPSGGSFYRHEMVVYSNDSKVYIHIDIINDNSTAFTISTLIQYLYNNLGSGYGIRATGYYKNGSSDFEIAYELNASTTTAMILKCVTETTGIHQHTISDSYGHVTDVVITL